MIRWKECAYANHHSTSIMKHREHALATLPQTVTLLILLSSRDAPSARPSELSGIGYRSGIGFWSGIGLRLGSWFRSGSRSTGRLPSRRRLGSSILFLFCLLAMNHTSNGTRTRVVPALTATGITNLVRSAAQRHKENP